MPFILLAALPIAGIISTLLAFTGNRLAAFVEDQRLQRLLGDVVTDLGTARGFAGDALHSNVANGIAGDADQVFARRALEPYVKYTVGSGKKKRVLCLTAEQEHLLHELLDEDDSGDRKIRLLLQKVWLQTEEYERATATA